MLNGCCLRTGVIGISYKTADLRLREEIARVSQKMAGERAKFFKHPTVLLSTCNRTEIYFSADDLAGAHSDLLSFLRVSMDEPFEHRLYSYFGIDCFFHLSRVASGLDSAILAETEIQRQVKLAYELSTKTLALPSCLHYLFQKSLKVGKTVRNCLSLERGASTLYGTLWMIAQKKFGDLAKTNLLLVGHSEISRGFATFLSHRGLKGFTLATRQDVRLEGAVVRDRECLASWSDFDWVVCAAKSEEYLIRGSGRGHQLIFDLSVPRNADPAIEGAVLWNIEQINQLVEQNRRLAETGLGRAEGTLQESVYRLARLYRAKLERSEQLLSRSLG